MIFREELSAYWWCSEKSGGEGRGKPSSSLGLASLLDASWFMGDVESRRKKQEGAFSRISMGKNDYRDSIFSEVGQNT